RRPAPGGLAAARGPSRWDIVAVRTVTMSHRPGCGAVTGAAAARREGPPGPMWPLRQPASGRPDRGHLPPGFRAWVLSTISRRRHDRLRHRLTERPRLFPTRPGVAWSRHPCRTGVSGGRGGRRGNSRVVMIPFGHVILVRARFYGFAPGQIRP